MSLTNSNLCDKFASISTNDDDDEDQNDDDAIPIIMEFHARPLGHSSLNLNMNLLCLMIARFTRLGIFPSRVETELSGCCRNPRRIQTSP